MNRPENYAESTEGQRWYEEKLRSPEWEAVRAMVFRRDGEKCRICGSGNQLDAHHLEYGDLFDKDRVVTLCHSCHRAVTEAVNRARDLEVKVELPDRFRGCGIETEKLKVGQKMEGALDRAYGTLVADTLFGIFRAWLKNGGDAPLRRPEALRRAGDIVVRSIEGQTDLRSVFGEVAFVKETIDRITDFTARGYAYYAGEGMGDAEIARALRVPPEKMVKVRRNAGRLKTGGEDGK